MILLQLCCRPCGKPLAFR